MRNKKIIGHIGLGYWGKNILRNLYELGVLHTACDVSENLLNERKKEYPQITFTNSYEEIIKNKEIKAVVISTPAVTHYELAKKALLADKDVFIEKPLALKVSEGEEIVKLAREKGKIVMVGHILNYHPAVIKLKEMIKNGELGKIQYIYSNRLNIGKIRTEENALLSLAPHDISLILSIIGELPEKITAAGGDYLNKNIQDKAITILEFKDKTKAHIFVSWLNPFKEQKFVVIGSEAMAVFDDVSKEKLIKYPHKINWIEGKIPVAEKKEGINIPIENTEPLKEELKHFIECVKTRKTPLTDGEEGLKVLKVLDGAIKSLERGVTEKMGETTNYFVHESSYIDEGVKIGEGTKIWHFSHILKGSEIGKNCIIGQNVVIGPEVKIGNRCKIQNNISLYKGVTLEDEVFCGPSCVFTNVYNPRAFIERKHEFRQTLVKQGATIGANATIVCGTTIGKYALIGAGAVITKDVPDYGLVYGNPGRLMGWVCKCGTVLVNKGVIKGKVLEDSKLSCEYCRSIYFYDKKDFYPIDEKI